MRCRGKIGHHIHLRLNAGISQKLAQATNLRKTDHMNGRPNGAHHGDNELHQIGEQHPGESPDHAVGNGDY